jgi:hypothetical protein
MNNKGFGRKQSLLNGDIICYKEEGCGFVTR